MLYCNTARAVSSCGKKFSIHARSHTQAARGFGARKRDKTGKRQKQVSSPLPTSKTTDIFKEPFHQINTNYPGLRVLHTAPDIFAIPDFFTPSECDGLVAKSMQRMLPCLVVDEDGNVSEDETRTSTNANVPRREVPSIVSKLCTLGLCDERQLETFQVLRYTDGDYFQPHTDGFEGPMTANGFVDSARLVTVFVYLNDVEQGGETTFHAPTPFSRLQVRPRKGLAVLHFPTTLGFEEDRRTEHEGVAAIDEKWLFVTWIWAHFRTDERYAESVFPSLSDEII